MKLRNKNTGQIIETCKIIDNAFGSIVMLTLNEDERYLYEYASLSELNTEWEDYKPKEPLIKDEKICKAVRAWAEANELSSGLKVINEHFNSCKIIGRCDSRNVCLEIEFKTTIAHVNKNQFYSIEELCGEEEE